MLTIILLLCDTLLIPKAYKIITIIEQNLWFLKKNYHKYKEKKLDYIMICMDNLFNISSYGSEAIYIFELLNQISHMVWWKSFTF